MTVHQEKSTGSSVQNEHICQCKEAPTIEETNELVNKWKWMTSVID